MIITNDLDTLRKKCSDAQPEEISEIIQALEKELDYSNKLGNFGIGLAAPQIGIQKNVAIVRIDDYYKANLVNCSIKNAYDEFFFPNEGCLSFPEFTATTKRYNEIHIDNNQTYPHSFIATGLFAVAIEHELNHLQGIILPDIAINKSVFKAGPNDPCPCGKINLDTNKPIKFKKCHGK